MAACDTALMLWKRARQDPNWMRLSRRVVGFLVQKTSTTGAMAGPRKRGRPSKGPRTTFSVRFPDELLAVLDAEVKTRGIDRNDVIVEKLARLYGVPVLSPPRQETLPLTEAA